MSELQRGRFRFLPAIASSISGDWIEESLAIWAPESKLGDELMDVVLKLAVEFEQNAVFKFLDNRQILVPVLAKEAVGSQLYCVNHCSNSA